MKKILSLDLGTTSIGYSVITEKETQRYSLLDYGVSMFDKPTDKDGNSKKLHQLRKERKKNLAKLFEKYNLASATKLLDQEKKNIYIHKWQLRAKKVFEEKLSVVLIPLQTRV